MAIRINILTHILPTHRHENYFFPLLKWKKELREKEIYVNFINYHEDRKVFDCDILMVNYRYFEQIIKKNFKPKGFVSDDLCFLEKLAKKASSKKVKSVLLNTQDSTLLMHPKTVKWFDLILKKQVFRNKDWYTFEYGGLLKLTWLPSKWLIDNGQPLKAIDKEDLEKIQVGWNIGLNDNRFYPWMLNKYLPFSTSILSCKVYNNYDKKDATSNRSLDFSFRGRVSNSPQGYSRNKMVAMLSAERDNGFQSIIGGKISKDAFLKELGNSKLGLSPFGWGEICHRDFEVMIKGALLIKPSMEHVETWPSWYIPQETYCSVSWEFTDLIDKMKFYLENVEERQRVAQNAQNLYFEYQNNGTLFTEHLSKQLKVLDV